MKKDKYHPANVQVYYINPFNGHHTLIELWHDPLGRFTVRAGASSDYSYTGMITGMTSMDDMRRGIEAHYKTGKLFK